MRINLKPPIYKVKEKYHYTVILGGKKQNLQRKKENGETYN